MNKKRFLKKTLVAQQGLTGSITLLRDGAGQVFEEKNSGTGTGQEVRIF